MTSATYSKSNFKQGAALFWWSVRSSVPVIIIYLSILAFFSMMNIISGMGLTVLLFGYENEGTKSAFMNFPVSAEIGNAVFLGVLFSFIASLKNFGYLHGKREIDMFGSLPVTRRTLFFSRLSAAVAVGAVPMLAILLSLNIFAPQTETNSWINTINALLGVTANVSFIGLLSICCGKTSDKVISYIIINAAFPVAVIMTQIMPASFLVGYNLNFNKNIILALTPLAAYASDMPIYWTVFTLACLALCFLLVKHRKSESAQSHFAFKLPHVLIKVLVSFATGVVTAYFFLFIGVTDKYEPNLALEYLKFWLGMLFGSFLVYLCIQIILAHGFKGFAKSLITYGVMIACFGVYFAILATSAFGYSSYVPSVENISSVSFTDDMEQTLLSRPSVDDEKVIKGAVEAHKQVIEQAEEGKSMITLSGERLSESLSLGTRYFDDDDNNFTITYYLKNGMKVRRAYTIEDREKISFLSSPEYYENYYPIFVCDSKYLSEAYAYSEKDEDNDLYDSVDFDEYSQELLDTLRADIRKYGIIESDEGTDVEFEFMANGDYSHEIEQSFCVPPEYKATTALIKKALKVK